MRLRRPATIAAVIAAGCAALAASSSGDLAGRYQAGRQHADRLKSAITADSSRIRGFEGQIGSLQARLRVIERSLGVQEQLLLRVRSALTDAQHREAALQAAYARDRQALAAQLRAQYESPQPTIVDVVISSQGFDDLLNRVGRMRTLASANAATVERVRAEHTAVAAEARRLAAVEARRQRSAAAVLSERDDVAQLKLSIVRRELAEARDRSQKSGQLHSLEASLSQQAARLDELAAAAQAGSGGAGLPPIHGCTSGPFVPHGGPWGFFLASGTNYSVGQEPIIAARLDALGRALQLHLIGISGYRTPEHSVEVGGFADDPHTQGLASDTPGVEGVPETTLAQFCLTRPFGGAAEADHIQAI